MAHDTGTDAKIPDATVLNDPNSGNPSAARRRLILAAGAVLPSVYTLTSGAQTAAASSLRCWANGGDTPPVRFTPAEDNWVRAKVYVGKSDDGRAAYCVSTPQNSCISRLDADKAADGSVWIVMNRGIWGVGPGLSQVSGSRIVAGPNTKITNVRRTNPAYGAIFVDEQGTIATLDPSGSPADLRPVAQSCFTSILGGRISKLG
jgi:hypothetical protein